MSEPIVWDTSFSAAPTVTVTGIKLRRAKKEISAACPLSRCRIAERAMYVTASHAVRTCVGTCIATCRIRSPTGCCLPRVSPKAMPAGEWDHWASVERYVTDTLSGAVPGAVSRAAPATPTRRPGRESEGQLEL